jgi:16S rRNA (uracil1498-N3)-methyltransferase
MHRFYLPPDRCRELALLLSGREAHHALHVLRLKRGDSVTVMDGAGHEFLCNVETGSRNELALRVTRKDAIPPLPFQLTLFQSLPKGKIIETIIQKAVELGAGRIAPLLTERVVAHFGAGGAEAKRDKWQQVAIEAAKQCGAAWLPEIEAPKAPWEILARREPFDLSLVGSLQPGSRHPREFFKEFQARNRHPPRSVAIWIGPEGDFTLHELKAIQAGGALPVTLGPLTLRVETAAIYCLSVLNYELSSRDL